MVIDILVRWLYDYWSGKKYEIYRIEIPSVFATQQFNSIAKQVYKQTGFVLFALEIVVGDENVNGEILLNPGEQRLPKPTN
jgi:Calcium-activated BK potassium channel alpha subunit